MTICLAALDLGSNLIRVAIGERPEGGTTQVIHKDVRVARIAEGLGGPGGTLGRGPIARAIESVSQLQRVTDEYGCRIGAAVGTGALRLAANRDAVVAQIEAETGVRIEIVDGVREARLSLRGVGTDLGLSADPQPGRLLTLLDIGGTTTEVIRAAAGAAATGVSEEAWSFEVGVITLTEWAVGQGASGREQKARAAEVFMPLAEFAADRPDLGGDPCFAAGGAAVALSAWRRREPFLSYMGALDDLLTPVDRRDIYAEFLASDPAARGRRLQVGEDVAALVPAGYAILDAVTEALGIADVRPTGRGVVEGLLDEMLV